MGMVREILANKGVHVYCIGKNATVLQAACVMNEHRIGALVVMDHDQVAGIFTERDVLQRVVAEQRDPVTTRVEEVMSPDVVCCTPQTTIEEARGAMKNRRLRHLPVIGADGKLHGLISIGDLNAYQEASHEQTLFLLHEYLYGRA